MQDEHMTVEDEKNIFIVSKGCCSQRRQEYPGGGNYTLGEKKDKKRKKNFTRFKINCTICKKLK